MGEATGAEPQARAPVASEWPGLLDWLDDGLRRGRRGRLAAEYPTLLSTPSPERHRVVAAAGVPLAHAMLHEARLGTPRGGLRVGLIGAVYTDPRARGRGLASRCVESCAVELARRGVPLALLWSDRHDFYRRLGFERAGVETQLAIDAACCERAGADRRVEVGPASPGDFAALERLHAEKPVRAERAAGDLARLAATPECRLRVARRHGGAVGYAALGRGDDFQGVIHEWAGEPGAVLACLRALCAEAGALELLEGPGAPELARRLRAAGAAPRTGCFALARPLDARSLWRATGAGASGLALEAEPDGLRLHGRRGRVRIAPAELLALCFGPGVPLRVSAALDARQRTALREHGPFPLYLWGFDSI